MNVAGTRALPDQEGKSDGGIQGRVRHLALSFKAWKMSGLGSVYI